LTIGAAGPFVRAGPGTIGITDERVFGPGNEALAQRFARRALSFPEIRSLALDPINATATLNYRSANGDAGTLLNRLANAIAEPDADLDETELPLWVKDEPITLYRHPDLISIFEGLNIGDGYFAAGHPALKRNTLVARLVEGRLRAVPEVFEAAVAGELRVRFDSAAVTATQLIRMAEAEISARETIRAIPVRQPVNFKLENVMIGVAVAGEFVLPLMAPVASGLLVLASIETFGAAASQLRERRIGLPLLYTCAVGSRLFSGQFLAASLISWFFRYWEYRYRQDVEVEIQDLIDETASFPRQARVLTADGSTRFVPRLEITAGQRVRVFAEEHVPVDGRVLTGAALVDENLLGRRPTPVHRVAGDAVFAGSKLLAGALDIGALRASDETYAVQIAQTLIETTVPAPHPGALNQDAEIFARRTVTPTLLTAGAGLVIADLTTAGAILSPDYASGVGLAMPLETVHNARFAMRSGAVIRTADALGRLATISWILLDDHPALHHAVCNVAELRTKGLDEARLLPAIAAAGMWLGGERASALARSCYDRGLVVRRATLREIDDDGVTVGFGGRLLRLRGRLDAAAGPVPPPLTVEVDGMEVAGVRFTRNGHPEVVEVVRRLQEGGISVFLASERVWAKQLGIDHYCGNMSTGDKIQFLHSLRRRSVAAAYIGDCLANAPVAREAHLSIDLAASDTAADTEWEQGTSDIALLTSSITPLPALCALARDSLRRRKRARYAVTIPNLLCVAGALAFGLTPTSVVLISNFGTSMAYNGAKRSLRKAAIGFNDAG
jgi:cation transport ATPase